ncbi:PilZ domain-containing protein [Tamilnaduibacter salinus]|uniref:PilZ domain-containing protein n=1 Tax=Tamilnaduibacter salinus TaxID=1484056 RepID=A0A2U1CV08_9GAMM|nr:PilZ domain-containing protein [Tamilnaduibacter salinus]PVY75330.1 PilZ domain-containing protein [Tamilnaduibacter salinus]
MEPRGEQDRRQFYRITDQVGLELKKLTGDETLPADPFGDGHLSALMDELQRLDHDIRGNLATLAERDRLVASLIKSLNSRVDALARIMTFEQNPLQPEQWATVTLSEGGVAFPSEDSELVPGRRVAMRLTLPPALFRPSGILDIVSESRDANGLRILHGEFVSLDEGPRQQIARHVMQWQIRRRQQQQSEQAIPGTGTETGSAKRPDLNHNQANQ